MEYNKQVIQSKYQLVPRTLVFIEKADQVLLIHKNKNDSFGFDKLNGIGGHIEKGEEPFEAARREVLEESGLAIDNLQLVAVIFIEIQINPGILMFVFKAEYSSGELNESDEGNLIWMNRTSIKTNRDVVKDVPFLLEQVDSHIDGSLPKFGKYLYNKEGELRIVI